MERLMRQEESLKEQEMEIKVEEKRKFFIYNPDTGNILTRKLYYDTEDGKKNLSNDLEAFQRLKPKVETGEAFMINDRIVRTIPKDVKFQEPI